MECDFFHDDVRCRPGVLCLTQNKHRQERKRKHTQTLAQNGLQGVNIFFAIVYSFSTSLFVCQFHELQYLIINVRWI